MSRSKLKFKLKNPTKMCRLKHPQNLPNLRRRQWPRLSLGRLRLSPMNQRPLKKVQRTRRQNKQSQRQLPPRKSSGKSSRRRLRPSSESSRRKWNL
jgi:hypothetical protein